MRQLLVTMMVEEEENDDAAGKTFFRNEEAAAREPNNRLMADVVGGYWGLCGFCVVDVLDECVSVKSDLMLAT